MYKVLLVILVISTWVIILKRHLPPVDTVEIHVMTASCTGLSCLAHKSNYRVDATKSKGHTWSEFLITHMLVMSKDLLAAPIVSTSYQGDVS